MISVLIIDDDFIIRQTTSAYLQDQNYEVYLAENGKIGIEQFEKQHTDIVIVDLQMPVLDGFQVVKFFKDNYEDVPIIIFSGNGVVSDAVTALQAGAWDYLMKPLADLEILNVTIEKNIRKAEILLENQTYKANLEVKNEQLERTNKELAHTLKKLEEDEIAGRKIQFQMLPQNNLHIQNFCFSHKILPSQFLSGDFLHYFKIDERYIGLYFADVAGHGVSSSFITVLINSEISNYRSLFQTHNDRTILEPVALIKKLNIALLNEKMEKFSTFFYAVIDTQDKKITWSNGGQFPFPIVFTESTVDYWRQNSMPIGIFDFATYETVIASYDSDFTFLLMSDGILEILPESWDLKQKEKYLIETTSQISEISTDKILETLNVTAISNLPDDITIMMFQYKQ